MRGLEVDQHSTPRPYSVKPSYQSFNQLFPGPGATKHANSTISPKVNLELRVSIARPFQNGVCLHPRFAGCWTEGSLSLARNVRDRAHDAGEKETKEPLQAPPLVGPAACSCQRRVMPRVVRKAYLLVHGNARRGVQSLSMDKVEGGYEDETKRNVNSCYRCVHRAFKISSLGKGKSLRCSVFTLLRCVICTILYCCILSCVQLIASSSMTLTHPMLLH